MFSFLKKQKTPELDNYESAMQQVVRRQQIVYNAVAAIGVPCSGRMIAQHLDWDSASVTNRLAELLHKGRITVAYRKRGLDGKWRKYYRVASC